MIPDDLEAARRLWEKCEGVEIAGGDSVSELSSYLRRNPGCSQVAIVNGSLVGAVLAGHDGRRGLLYHLAVAKEARGQGIGRALSWRAIQALQAAGISRALILVAADNQNGSAFWQSQGWQSMPFALPMGVDL